MLFALCSQCATVFFLVLAITWQYSDALGAVDTVENALNTGSVEAKVGVNAVIFGWAGIGVASLAAFGLFRMTNSRERERLSSEFSRNRGDEVALLTWPSSRGREVPESPRSTVGVEVMMEELHTDRIDGGGCLYIGQVT